MPRRAGEAEIAAAGSGRAHSLGRRLSRSFTRVTVASVAAVVVALAFFAVSAFDLQPHNAALARGRAAVDQLNMGMLDQQQGLYGFLATGSSGYLDTSIRRGQDEVRDGEAGVEALAASSPELAPRVTAMLQAQRRWLDGWATRAARPDAPLSSSPDPETAFTSRSFLVSGQSLFSQFISARDDLVRAIDAGLAETGAASNRLVPLAVALELLLGAIVVVLWVVERRSLRRWVLRPVNALLESIERLGRGERAVGAPAGAPIELARIGEALRTTAGALGESRAALEAERAAAAASERRTFQFLDGLPVGVLVLGGAGEPVYANPSARDLLGSEIGTTDGPALRDVFGPRQAGTGAPYPAGRLPITAALRGTAAEVDDMEIDRAGRRLRLAVRATPVRDSSGELQHIVASLIDVTAAVEIERLAVERSALERHAAELAESREALRLRAEELERSNRELERFAYVASHDLQEPLRMVASYVQLLARRYRGRLDGDADEIIGYAVEGATRMKSLLTDLLAFSRVDRRAAPRAGVDVGACLEAATASLAGLIRSTGATVHHGALPVVEADPGQLRQLFEHLLHNSITFASGAAPEVAVSADRDGDTWRFTVSDNGPGIPPHQAERVFTIFQRLQARADHAGNGIGLALCRKIVEHHGGRIWVEPRAGRGTTVRFTLPVGAAGRVEARGAVPAA